MLFLKRATLRTAMRARILASRLLQRWPLDQISGRVEHLVGAPNLRLLDRHSRLLTSSPLEAAEAVLRERVDYTDEYARVRERVSTRPGDSYPSSHAIEDATAFLLYTLARHAKPSLVVEVGVAAGRSTQVILSALDANDAGRLVSVDIDEAVGGAARGHPRWSLRVHSPGRTASRQLGDLLAELGPPDLFFHDAAHTYPDQCADYLVAWEQMRPGSLFASDDVDWSFAFIDLTRAVGVNPVVLTDRRKAAGVLLHP
jgi:predicted O-methyltransferase YrrM